MVHEPFPSRYELMLGNFRNITGIGGSLLRQIFLRSRQKSLEAGCYIEVNPLLCPITDMLLYLPVTLNIIHIVREPIAWAQSITQFRASSYYRHVIDFIPFTKPYPKSKPRDWFQLSETDRALWRWRFCNERIASLQTEAQSYTLIRYEELFSDDLATRKATFKKMSAALPMPLDGSISEEEMVVRRNERPKLRQTSEPDLTLAQRICSELAAQFGYANW